MLQYHLQFYQGVVKYNKLGRLETVKNKIVRIEVHRLLVVKEEYSILGIISLPDILQALIVRPPDGNNKNKAKNWMTAVNAQDL